MVYLRLQWGLIAFNVIGLTAVISQAGWCILNKYLSATENLKPWRLNSDVCDLRLFNLNQVSEPVAIKVTLLVQIGWVVSELFNETLATDCSLTDI